MSRSSPSASRQTATTLGLSLLLSVAALALVAWWLGDLRDLREVVRLPAATLALALLALLVQLVAGGVRLQILLAVNGERLGSARCVRAFVVGFFAAAVTPSGGGSAPATALSLVRDRVTTATAWSVSIYAGVVDLLFFAWAIPLLVGVVWATLGHPGPLVLALAGVASLVDLALWYALAFRPELLERLLVRLVSLRMLRRWYRPLKRLLAGVGDSMRHTTRAPLGSQLLLQAVTAAGHAATALIFWIVARGLGGQVALLPSVALVMLVAMSTYLVPTPGGSGYFEVVVSALFAQRLPAEVLAPALLAWRAISFYGVVLLGVPLGGHVLVRAVLGERSDGDAGAP